MNDKIDLSSLDPTVDSERWNRLVESVTARALAARGQLTLASQLLEWARPTLAVAASVAMVAWWGASFRAPEAMPVGHLQKEAPWILTRWAVSGEEPPVASMLEVLGAGQQ
jgi:hypothetical protein